MQLVSTCQVTKDSSPKPLVILISEVNVVIITAIRAVTIMTTIAIRDGTRTLP